MKGSRKTVPKPTARVKRGVVPVGRPGETAPREIVVESRSEPNKWFLMADAMDKALASMRTQWDITNALQALHARSGCQHCHPGNWMPLLDAIDTAANVLLHGLKARPARGSNRK